MESTGFDDTTNENLDLPYIGDLYNLSSPYVYALAKWAAVIRYQDNVDPLHKSEAAQCYEGEPGTCRWRLSLPFSYIFPAFSPNYQPDRIFSLFSAENVPWVLVIVLKVPYSASWYSSPVNAALASINASLSLAFFA